MPDTKLPSPASREDDIDTREKAAYSAGRRDADVDYHLQQHELSIRSHEGRLNAINGSIDRGARETASLRESVDEMSKKVTAIAGALQIADAVNEATSTTKTKMSERVKWIIGTVLVVAAIIATIAAALISHYGL